MGRVQWRNQTSSGSNQDHIKEHTKQTVETMTTENDEAFMKCENEIDNQYYSYLLNSPDTKRKLQSLKRLAVIDLSTSKSTGKLNLNLDR